MTGKIIGACLEMSWPVYTAWSGYKYYWYFNPLKWLPQHLIWQQPYNFHRTGHEPQLFNLKSCMLTIRLSTVLIFCQSGLWNLSLLFKRILYSCLYVWRWWSYLFSYYCNLPTSIVLILNDIEWKHLAQLWESSKGNLLFHTRICTIYLHSVNV